MKNEQRKNILLFSPAEQIMTVKRFNWALKISPNFQNLASHFSEVDASELLDQH